MTRSVTTRRPGSTGDDRSRGLEELGANALPVVDGAGRLVGIVSRKDLQRHAGATATVSDAMTSRIVTIFADQTLDAALVKMGRHAILAALPVVRRGDPNRVVGIVTLRDIGAHRATPA